MGQKVEDTDPICNVTEFHVDDNEDLSTRLTVRVRTAWFHIFADHASLLSNNEKSNKVADKYLELHQAYTQKKTASDGDAKGDGLEQQEAVEDAETQLQNWMLAPFGTVFADKAPENDSNGKVTLYDWYEAPLHVYSLKVGKGSKLEPVEDDDEDRRHSVELSLCPHFVLPKYVRKLTGIEWYSPKNLLVLNESDAPPPYHPAQVQLVAQDDKDGQKDGRKGKQASKKKPQEFFLKMHIPHQDPATMREIKHLHKIQKLGLENKGLRIPRLRGYVSHVRNPNSEAQILGFLLDPIASPTALTHKMDSSVDEKQRNKWAAESEKMVRILHDNGIVWGDAKGDNFVVDSSDQLWMIDFGGGYTEGWVEPELMETLEGDKAGMEKLVNGLHDPDGESDAGEGESSSRPPSNPAETSKLFMTKKTGQATKPATTPATKDAGNGHVNDEANGAKSGSKRSRPHEDEDGATAPVRKVSKQTNGSNAQTRSAKATNSKADHEYASDCKAGGVSGHDSNGKASNGKVTNGKATRGKAINGKATNGKVINGKAKSNGNR